MANFSDAVQSLQDAQASLSTATVTDARAILSEACGRSSLAHVVLKSLAAQAKATSDRTLRASLRADRAVLKSEMDATRAMAQGIISQAAVEYQTRAAQNKAAAVAQSLDAKRARFLKLRDWLRENDSDWLEGQSG